MICKACKEGLHNRPLVRFIEGVEHLVYKCKGGTWCDCQHKKEGVARKITRRMDNRSSADS